ncbi:MAG: hypothetical protein KGZ63_12425 [Clostridiales bacterium]|nr:hypothetical protein [Clostridiales bacterium]
MSNLQGQKLPMGRFPLRKREYGGIRPFFPLGPFKVHPTGAVLAPSALPLSLQSC